MSSWTHPLSAFASIAMRAARPASQRRSDHSHKRGPRTTTRTLWSTSVSRCDARGAERVVRPASSRESRTNLSMAARARSSRSGASAASIAALTRSIACWPVGSHGRSSARLPGSETASKYFAPPRSHGRRCRIAGGNVTRAFEASVRTSVQTSLFKCATGFQLGGRPAFMGHSGKKSSGLLHRLSRGCKQESAMICRGFPTHPLRRVCEFLQNRETCPIQLGKNHDLAFRD